MNLPETHDTTETFDRIPWHKPSVQRLMIAVDTRLGGGSVIDQDGFDFIVQDQAISV